ncbi:MAG: hypothetical protein A2W99_01830 [Bacteroidetes bacterium GWF2_33_16]|nr:MAG: hypothetical protein A2X00_16325 [Bacteroidetes bacterium GWE2_32_14]OFY07009.1 MAG: hypothetical protein A2W99_01830 [Bacteroidetes bacterium GWF2_33_16]
MNLKLWNSDAELINKCLKQDRLAQKELYDKYKNAMYTLAYRIIGNHDDAEDTLQETFVSVFLNLQSFQGRSTLGAWIKTILIRNAIKCTKASFLHESVNDIEINNEFIIDDNLSGEHIEKAILNLDKGYRTVFLLIEVEGYKHKEVSEILNISEGTSKSQLFHAKKQLQKQLVSMYK